MREELSTAAAAVATIAAQGVELSKERSEGAKARSVCAVAVRHQEELTKELEEAQCRLKVAGQEIQTLRAQTRGAVQQRFNYTYSQSDRSA
jgi:hypothetical protein